MEIDNLAICFYMLCVYVCYLFRYNATTKSLLAPGCGRQLGCPCGASNRRRTSYRVRLLLVPQRPQSAIKLATRYVKECLRFLCNGRYTTLSTSPISVIVAPTDNQIGTRALIACFRLISNGRGASLSASPISAIVAPTGNHLL
jgi:hypothetical protein